MQTLKALFCPFEVVAETTVVCAASIAFWSTCLRSTTWPSCALILSCGFFFPSFQDNFFEATHLLGAGAVPGLLRSIDPTCQPSYFTIFDSASGVQAGAWG